MQLRGTRLRIRVSPRADAAAIVGRHGGAWKLRVTAAPERGRANEAVVTLLADTLGLQPAAVRLVGGGSGRDKVVQLDGLSAAEADRRLAAAQQVRSA